MAPSEPLRIDKKEAINLEQPIKAFRNQRAIYGYSLIVNTVPNSRHDGVSRALTENLLHVVFIKKAPQQISPAPEDATSFSDVRDAVTPRNRAAAPARALSVDRAADNLASD